MVRERLEKRGETRSVYYTRLHWELLHRLRTTARDIMEALARYNLRSLVHGSVARGDVHEESDIDVFIPYPVPSYRVELALEQRGFKISHKLIVQATPHNTPKVYLSLDVEEKRVVSFPLASLNKREYEFYFFGGALWLEDVRRGKRVPGVTKRLVLIEPTEWGHIEYSIIGREAEAAKKIGISIDTVLERVKVLTRRSQLGRTGVFVKVELEPWDSIEEAVENIARNNPAFRKILRERNSPLI